MEQTLNQIYEYASLATFGTFIFTNSILFFLILLHCSLIPAVVIYSVVSVLMMVLSYAFFRCLKSFQNWYYS